MGSVFEGYIADAQLKVLQKETWIDGDDMGKLANRHSVLIGQLLAIELLGAGALSERHKTEDPNIVGAQRADKLIDIGVESIDG